MTPRITTLLVILVAAVFVHATEPTLTPAAPTPPAPLRALLITGGCCHDYTTQTKHLTEAVAKVASVEWTIVNEGGTGTRAEISLYNNPDWAKPYDIIVHNECFADTDDPAYFQKITAAHRAGKPAVVIHCAMHTYRAAKTDDWREFLGVTSRRHDHQSRYVVRNAAPTHPALKNFPETWLTPLDELYIIEKLWPTATPLAVSTSEKDAQAHPVIWINDYHGTRVFGTTFGHGNATWEDPVFQNLLAHGLLWAAGREK
ncbi:MAG: ThuA domain-containing protein [Nibricoccus sp.]